MPTPMPSVPEPQPAAAPSKKGWKTSTVVLAVLGGMVLLLCLVGAIGAAFTSGDDKPTAVEATKKATTRPAAPVAEPTTAAPPAEYKPTKVDFKLTVKVLTKQCFGSAGCNLTFRISNVTYSGQPLDPDKEYEITYQYRGLEDPMVNTFTMKGDGSYSIEAEEFGSTKRSSDRVTAVVTEIAQL